MFIKKEIVPRSNNKGKKTIIYLKCDQCYIKFIRTNNFKKYINNDIHFCSKECVNISRKSGKLKEKNIKVFLEKYNTTNPSKIQAVKEKKKSTLLNNYGVDSPLKSQEIKNKFKLTCINKYGVDNPSKSLIVKNKKQSTIQKNFGVNCVFESKIIKSKIKEILLKKYGTDNPLKSEIILNKIKNTLLKKYGVDSPFKSIVILEKAKQTTLKNFGQNTSLKSEAVKEKIKNTNITKYGSENVFGSELIRSKINYKQVFIKAHNTKKQNNIYGKSKIEDDFYNFLCQSFLFDDIERQKIVNNWSIDFYIKSLDLYIQFDGSYYHGLDRPIDIIKNSKLKIDNKIYLTYLRDRFQNTYFLDNNLKLLRITDIEFKRNNFKYFFADLIKNI